VLKSIAWPLGALVLAALSVVSLSLVWSTQQRVKTLEQELVRRQQSSQDRSKPGCWHARPTTPRPSRRPSSR
jgi:membrane protein implicated in regulation of membrane protease activity